MQRGRGYTIAAHKANSCVGNVLWHQATLSPSVCQRVRETPYSVVTNGSVIHPLSLNYRSRFFWLRFAPAYGSICTLYNSAPQFTSGIYYNGLCGISSLTPAAFLERQERGQKSSVIWQQQCPLSLLLNSLLLLCFFCSICTPALCATPYFHPHTTNFLLILVSFFPFVVNLIFMGFTVLAQAAPYLPPSRGKGNSWCWFPSPSLSLSSTTHPFVIHFGLIPPVFGDNPNSLLFPLHRLDDIPISTYHIQGKLYTRQTFLFSSSCLLPSFYMWHLFNFLSFSAF